MTRTTSAEGEGGREGEEGRTISSLSNSGRGGQDSRGNEETILTKIFAFPPSTRTINEALMFATKLLPTFRTLPHSQLLKKRDIHSTLKK